MKDLELTVYPREVHPVYGLRYLTGVGDPAGWWEWTELNAATRGVHAHRLSDAELAAEYWRAQHDFAFIAEGIIWGQMCGHWSFGEDDASARTKTLERFATLPHYDEVSE